MPGSLRVSLVGIWLAALTLAAPAEAAFPGANGRIAYVGNSPSNVYLSNVYVSNPDGTGSVDLTNNSDPSRYYVEPIWSPDGSKILFSTYRYADDTYTIGVMNADGSNQTTVSSGSGSDIALDWSPDAQKIVFERRHAGTSQLHFQLYVMNADGTAPIRLTDDPGGIRGGAWSPDGTRIAFIGSEPGNPGATALYTIEPTGRNQTVVAHIPNLSYNLDWSPSGHELLVELFQFFTFDLWRLNSDGSGLTRLTTSLDPDLQDDLCAFQARGGSWSPDGGQIVFIREHDCVGAEGNAYADLSAIGVMNADGSNQQTVINTGILTFPREPDWQPIPGPRRENFKNAAAFCRAERDFLGDARFEEKFGGGANAYGKCVSAK